MTTTASVRERVIGLLEPLVEQLGYELVDVEWVSAPRSGVLRIFIDQPVSHGGHIGIEDCETVSREVSALLDVEVPALVKTVPPTTERTVIVAASLVDTCITGAPPARANSLEFNFVKGAESFKKVTACVTVGRMPSTMMARGKPSLYPTEG